MDKRTLSPQGKDLGADTTGPSVASRYIFVELYRFRLKPKVHLFSFLKPESRLFSFGWGHQTNAMRNPTAACGARPPSAGGVHFSCWGNHRRGGRAVGRLNLNVKVAIEGA